MSKWWLILRLTCMLITSDNMFFNRSRLRVRRVTFGKIMLKIQNSSKSEHVSAVAVIMIIAAKKDFLALQMVLWFTGQQQYVTLQKNNHFPMLQVYWAQICSQIFSITSGNWDLRFIPLTSIPIRVYFKIQSQQWGLLLIKIESYYFTPLSLWCNNWCNQVCTFHGGCKQGIDQQIFNRKPISRKITHPQSWNLQAKFTGEKLKCWSNSREKQTQDYNQNFVTQAHKS